jgi:hypothetical protein
MWLDDCQHQYDELCNIDPMGLSNMEFANLIIDNMPTSTEWRGFLSGLREKYSEKREIPTSITVIDKIREEHWARHKDDPETYRRVFAARFQAEKVSKRPLYADANEERNLPPRKQQRPMFQRPDWTQRICTVKDCETPIGHTAPDCFSYGGGKQGQYAPWYRGPRDIHLPKDQRAPRRMRLRAYQTTIREQEQIGAHSTGPPDYQTPQTHLPNYQSIDDSRAAPTPPSVDPEIRANLSSAQLQTWLTHLPAGTIDNVGDEKLVCAIRPIPINPGLNDPDECYHDSASNQHVFNRRELFQNYRDITPVKVHGFNEGFETAALGVGDVVVEGEYRGAKKSFTIRNCIYVPGARANLISQVRLDKVGVSAWFDEGRVTLYRDKKPCIDGHINRDEMYLLNFRPILSDKAISTPTDNFLVMTARNNKTPGFYTA